MMQNGNRINAERLKEARLFRRMTMDELASIVGFRSLRIRKRLQSLSHYVGLLML